MTERKILGIPESEIIKTYLGPLAKDYVIHTLKAYSPRQGKVLQTRMYKQLPDGDGAQFIIAVACSSSGKVYAAYRTNLDEENNNVDNGHWVDVKREVITMYDQDGEEKLQAWVTNMEFKHREKYGKPEESST
tara:strand:- start:16111 stop:16509 length:399 start_codon:yes stop_codon:yes gene_type:complete